MVGEKNSNFLCENTSESIEIVVSATIVLTIKKFIVRRVAPRSRQPSPFTRDNLYLRPSAIIQNSSKKGENNRERCVPAFIEQLLSNGRQF